MKRALILLVIVLIPIFSWSQYTGFKDNREEKSKVLIIDIDSMYTNSIDTIQFWDDIGKITRNGNFTTEIIFMDLDCEDSKYDLGLSNSGIAISTLLEIEGVTLPITLASTLCEYEVDGNCYPDLTYIHGAWNSEYLVHIYDIGSCTSGKIYLSR